MSLLIVFIVVGILFVLWIFCNGEDVYIEIRFGLMVGIKMNDVMVLVFYNIFFVKFFLGSL